MLLMIGLVPGKTVSPASVFRYTTSALKPMSSVGAGRNVVRDDTLKDFSPFGRFSHDGASTSHSRAMRRFSISDIFAMPTLSLARMERNSWSDGVPPVSDRLRLRAVPTPRVVMSGSFAGLNAVTLSCTQPPSVTVVCVTPPVKPPKSAQVSTPSPPAAVRPQAIHDSGILPGMYDQP